jgi:hypothetical protein
MRRPSWGCAGVNEAGKPGVHGHDGAFQKAQIEKWWPLIKEFGIKVE